LQILLNGEFVATEARTLGELCAALGFAETKVATALNGAFVAASKRDVTQLSPKDEVEIVAPRQGG
jgi:sulfur carrier protein